MAQKQNTKKFLTCFFITFAAVFFAAIFLGFTTVKADDEKILLPVYAQEQSISFTYFGGRNAYHCDFVRAETSAILRKLGATDIQVFCRGGLPYDRANYIEAQFISSRQTTTEKSTRMGVVTPIQLNFISSCELHSVVVENVLLGFDTFELQSSGPCRNAREPLTYRFKTLF